MLGLMVSSIAKFAGELGSNNVIRKHVERSRARTVGRTVTTSLEMEHRTTLQEGERPVISSPISPPIDASKPGRSTTFDLPNTGIKRAGTFPTLRKVATLASSATTRRPRQPRLILLREEKDRFDAMRHIQADTARFKRWSSLVISVLVFAIIWCMGAFVFWRCEKDIQGMTYFEALYLCYVSLLTIGYGDLAPQSNPGRPFFVLWSLVAVPSMTILVSDLGDTVISKFKNGTSGLADFTVLPKNGIWREALIRFPGILDWLQSRKERRDAKKRLEEGLPVGPEPLPQGRQTIDELATDEPSNEDLARRLPDAIKQTVLDIKNDPKKRYTYEEWVAFTQLIRFSARSQEDRETEDADEGLIEWDWIGEDSPMMFQGNEAEFVLERLCESLNRWIRQTTRATESGNLPHGEDETVKQPPSQRRGFDTSDSDSASLRKPATSNDSPNSDDVGPLNEKAQ